MIEKVKVGRPKKEVKQKQFTKEKYNQLYYLNITKNRRLLNKLISNYSLENEQITNKQYKKAIIKHFSKYLFTHFFTGTANPNFFQREQIDVYNKKYIEINKEYQTEFALKKYIPISLNGLKRYTGKFLSYLIKLNVIDRAIVFYEQNKAHEWHCHLLINVVNNEISDINFFLENKWLLGLCINVSLETAEDRLKVLQYSTKQLSVYGKTKSDKDKVLNWEIIGDFNAPNQTVNNIKMKKITKEQIEAIEQFKRNNGMVVIVDQKHQKILNDKFIRVSA